MHNKTKTINLSVSGIASPVAHVATFEQQNVDFLSCKRAREEKNEE